jgi:hypothetical protein
VVERVAALYFARAECVSISRHYLDKFPWQSKMCLKAMCNVRRYRQRRQRDDCVDQMHALHDTMEQKVQRFIDAQLAALKAWRETVPDRTTVHCLFAIVVHKARGLRVSLQELAEWSKVVAQIRQLTRSFAHKQEELRVARQQVRSRVALLNDRWPAQNQPMRVLAHRNTHGSESRGTATSSRWWKRGNATTARWSCSKHCSWRRGRAQTSVRSTKR